MDLSLEDVCRRLSRRNKLILIRLCIDDAVANAESVLAVFEAAYPEDERPRRAIEATKVASEMIERFLAGQAEWREIERITTAVSEAGEAVSEETLYIVKRWPAWHAASAACHAAHTAGEATGKAVEAVANAACAAAAATTSWMAETNEDRDEVAKRGMSDDVYNTKCEELRRIAVQLLAKQ